MSETAFIEMLRVLATDPAARGLADDAAVIEIGGTTLVLTHDMIVEGVHFLSDDPPADIAWKLVAVNLSDLAAKGARPLGVLMGYSLAADADWDAGFVAGLGTALGSFGLPLLGGDTVALPEGAPRSFGLTAIGEASGRVPARADGRDGDDLWVSGMIGDAGAGLRLLRGELPGPAALAERYRNPRPRLEAGARLAPIAGAMMDVSDGLLIDAARLGHASGVAVEIDLAAVPLSAELLQADGPGRPTRLRAATAGDDYELLFTAAPGQARQILDLAEEIGLALTRIGGLAQGRGLRLRDGGEVVPLPQRLGWEHR